MNTGGAVTLACLLTRNYDCMGWLSSPRCCPYRCPQRWLCSLHQLVSPGRPEGPHLQGHQPAARSRQEAEGDHKEQSSNGFGFAALPWFNVTADRGPRTPAAVESRMRAVEEERAFTPKHPAHIFAEFRPSEYNALGITTATSDRLVNFSYSVSAYRAGPSKDSMIGMTY